MTYFWRAHTITVLVVTCCVLIYVAIFEDPSQHTADYNFRRGVVACIFAFILLSVTQLPDGPFRRPHPALWRLILSLSIVYELFLIFLLFQTVDYSRSLMKLFDENLGKPLPEKDYGGSCLIYDRNNTEDPFHLFKDKLDCFVPTHFFGWWIKTLMLRDWWMCHVQSILFELLEYTLEHQLPNFSECWWDHWIMDFLICNTLGIYMGMKTLRYLSLKPYHWQGIWNIRSYREKMSRLGAQFMPYSWTDFDWRPTTSLKRWLAVLSVIAVYLVAELNTFYLKFVLWIPPEHYLNLTRLIFFIFMGSVAMRETFQYLDDPNCKRFGRQAWLVAIIIVTEALIIFKYDWETVTRPIPRHMTIFWIGAIFVLTVYTLWKFYFSTHLALYFHSRRRLSTATAASGTSDKQILQNESATTTDDSPSSTVRSTETAANGDQVRKRSKAKRN